MAALQLKRFRIEAGLTQAEVAKNVHVSQPTYQRWEAGAQTLPDDKLQQLADVFEVPVAVLTGRHAPINLRTYDSSAPDLSYFGEAVFHFAGGGEPLLLHISDSAAAELEADLNNRSPFIVVRSLSNQLVALRRGAITDVYLQGEACDDYGPEHDSYEVPPVMMPDPRDWMIVECLEHGLDLDAFNREDVQRVKQKLDVPWTDPVDDQITRGALSLRTVDAETVAKSWRMALSLVNDCTYQLSCGKLRSFSVDAGAAMYRAFDDIFSGMLDIEDEGDITFHDPEAHKTIYIRGAAIDYVTIPHHKWLDSSDEGEE
jgi:Predicted transcriptional regulators